MTDKKVWYKLALSWGVIPVLSEEFGSTDVLFHYALKTAKNTLKLETGDTVVMTAVDMNKFAEPYTTRGADAALRAGKIVIFGCGLGAPYFSTDTAAVLRAAEINADVVLLAKNIDGIYSADPRKDANAIKLDEISYKDMIDQGLAAMDITATSFSMDNNIPLLAFGLDDPENIYRAVMGEKIGTTIHGGN